MARWYRSAYSLTLLAVVLCLLAVANQADPASLGQFGDRVRISGTVSTEARPEFDLGPADPSVIIGPITLALHLRPEGRTDLEALIDNQQDPKSSEFHRWLTPEEFADRFGISATEIGQVTQWLQDSGLVVNQVARGRQWLTFSGSVSKIQATFQTEIHDFTDEVGGFHYSNIADVSVPKQLVELVKGPIALNDFEPRLLVRRANSDPNPLANGGSGFHYLSPSDLATIYHIAPLYTAGISGTGTTIAIVGRTDISIADLRAFRTQFGLPAKDPTIIDNGPAPGNLGGDEEAEALLDLDWSAALAPMANIKFVTTAKAGGGVVASAQYVVDNAVAPIMSMSFLSCEAVLGSHYLDFMSNLWEQAAVEGISVFVASGDSGAAGCETGDALTGSGRAVNGLCSPSNSICVGGTQFADTSNPSSYWYASETGGHESARSYIPEIGWNESAYVGGSGLWSSGGGQSTYFPKPSWQAAPGVPRDGARDVPDLSLTSAPFHDPYAIVRAGKTEYWGGTSAASPSMSGIMALVVQKSGGSQGNPAPRLYQLGNAQYGASGPNVFHDATAGYNSVTGVVGFNCTAGYDLVTGLGSIDASLLANNWVATGSGLPNLVPYRPDGWSGIIVLSKTATGTTDATTITPSDSLYLSWAVENSGSASATATFDIDLYLDGAFMVSWSGRVDQALPSLYYASLTGISIGHLTAGTHHISMIIDPGHAIAESNESDNSFSRSVTVATSQQNLPNLSPFQPVGWSSPIVLSKVAGSTLEAQNISSTDSLYLDWAVENSGTVAANARFYTYLYLDNRYMNSWSGVSTGPLDVGYYSYLSDVPIGRLSGGKHTITLVADPTNAIAETSENDNTFSLTVQVSEASTCDPRTDPRCGVHIVVPSPRPPRGR